MKRRESIQKVNDDVKKWDAAIAQAEDMLRKVERRAARLQGAIKTFAELRDKGHAFDVEVASTQN